MVRALDHLVLPCRDLDAAAAQYAALGFRVGRRNRHPWGTENHIVQFDGAFLELIAPAPGAPLPRPEDDAFPFAGFLAGIGGSADPSGMIVLRSTSTQADADAFEQAGIGEGRKLHFARSGASPDGGTRTVSFSLAFATSLGMPDVGLFTCLQHTPAFFWNAADQNHANGVTGVASVILVAKSPAGHAAVLGRFSGQETAVQRPGGFALDLGNARLEVIDEATAATELGVNTADDRPVRLAAVRFAGKAGSVRPTRVALDDGLVLLFP